METKLYWKTVWKVFTAVEHKTTIGNTLKLVKKELLGGLTTYKSDLKNFDESLKVINVEKTSKMVPFLKELCVKLIMYQRIIFVMLKIRLNFVVKTNFFKRHGHAKLALQDIILPIIDGPDKINIAELPIPLILQSLITLRFFATGSFQNLDLQNTWEIFCNYIMFDSCHTMEDMSQILIQRPNTLRIIAGVWHFYSLERMFILKTFDCILRHREGHTNAEVSQFISQISNKSIQESLINQFEYLISEITAENEERCVELNDWISRNNSEQLQVLVLIIASTEITELDIKSLLRLLKLFKKHSYAEAPYYRRRNALVPGILENVCYAEIALLIIGLKGLWFNDESWYPYFDDLKSALNQLPSNGGHIITLAWSVLQLTLSDDFCDISQINHLKLCIRNAFKHKVLLDIQNIQNHPTIKSTPGEDVINMALFEFLEVLCIKCPQEPLYFADGALSLVVHLLRSKPVLSKFYGESTNCLKNMFTAYIMLFPSKFEPLTLLYESIFNSGVNLEGVIRNLSCMPTFAERWSENVQNESLALTTPYRPFNNDSLVFPVGSKLIYTELNNQNYRIINSPYSYLTVLNHLVTIILDKHTTYENFHEDPRDMIVMGCRLVLKMMKNCHYLLMQIPDSLPTLQNIIRLMCSSSQICKTSYKVLRPCFDVVVALFKHNPTNVCEAIRCSEFLPEWDERNKLKGYSSNNIMTEFEVFKCIYYEENLPIEISLLVPYIKLVRRAIKLKQFHFEIQIPGLIILLGKFFPDIMHKDYMHCSEGQEIAIQLMKLLYTVLVTDRTNLSETELELNNSVMDLFINNKRYLAALVKLIESGSTKLDLIYMTNPNMYTNPVLGIKNRINKSLLCLLLLLKFILRYSNMNKHEMFEIYLSQNEEDRISVLNRVISFMSHGVNFEMPIIAISVLTEFVKASRMQIFPQLALNDVLIENMFLERLRDPLEDNTLKIGIIHLVEACVGRQKRMAASFFNRSKIEQPNTSMISYLKDYISAIELGTIQKDVTIYQEILSLIHSAFKRDQYELIIDVMLLDPFWNVVTWPIFKPTTVKIEVILKLFEILIIQCTNNVNQDTFNMVLEEMFKDTNNFLLHWSQRFSSISKQEPTKLEMYGKLYDLNNASVMMWKNFIISVQQFHPEYLNVDVKLFLLHESFDILNYLCINCEVLVIEQWTELCHFLISKITIECICTEKELQIYVPNILQNLADQYLTHSYSYKLIILATLALIAERHAFDILKERRSMLIFLRHLQWIFRFEGGAILASTKNTRIPDEHVNLFAFIIRIINAFLKENSIIEFEIILFHMQYLENIMEIFVHSLKNYLPLKIIHTAGRALKNYAESKLAHHFVLMNLDAFYERVFPERKYLLRNNNFPNGIIPQHLRDWWLIYPHILHLNRALLRSSGVCIVEKVLFFTYIHEDALCDAIEAAFHIGDYYNIRLVANITYFVHDALGYQHKWTELYRDTYEHIMINLTKALNVCITVFLRPEVLFFIPEERFNAPVFEYLTFKAAMNVPHMNKIQTVNRYLHLASWICLCFIRRNPPLEKLYSPGAWWNFSCLIANDFRVPQMFQNLDEITFSTITSALHYLCKVFDKMDDALLSTEKQKEESVLRDLSESVSIIILSNNIRQIIDLIAINGRHPECVPVGPQYEWMFSLDKGIVLVAIETFTTLLASHAYFAVRGNANSALLRYIRRELCEELEIVYESVQKYVSSRAIVDSSSSTTLSLNEHSSISNLAELDFKRDQGSLPVNQLSLNKLLRVNLTVDVEYACTGKRSGDLQRIVSLSDAYLVALVYWLRNYCKLKHVTHFDRILAKWHGRTTCALPNCTFIKYSDIRLEVGVDS